jgi:MoaA/NifB/PqqE/SkfB family radical SAM enzyme
MCAEAILYKIAGIKKRSQLLRGLFSRRLAFTGPYYVDVEVTRRCNMYCLGCQFHSSKSWGAAPGDHAVKDISLPLVERLCEDFPGLGIREVILIGEGEPLLHPRLFDIVSAFKRAHCKVQIFTNGTLINEDAAKAIMDSGLDVLKVSLWASNIEEYEKNHPRVDPKNFQKTMDGVKLIARLRKTRGVALPGIILTQPLNRYNYASISERIALAHSLGCDGLRFSCFNSWQEEFADANLTVAEMKVVLESLTSAREHLKALGMIHNIDNILLRYRLGETAFQKIPCYAGWFYTRIKVDGTVLPCGFCYLSLGDLNESSFKEVWNGAKYRSFRKESSTLKGLASLASCCHCNWCCFVEDNYRVHKGLKWLAPLLRS